MKNQLFKLSAVALLLGASQVASADTYWDIAYTSNGGTGVSANILLDVSGSAVTFATPSQAGITSNIASYNTYVDSTNGITTVQPITGIPAAPVPDTNGSVNYGSFATPYDQTFAAPTQGSTTPVFTTNGLIFEVNGGSNNPNGSYVNIYSATPTDSSGTPLHIPTTKDGYYNSWTLANTTNNSGWQTVANVGTIHVSAVPEAEEWAMMIVGLGVVGVQLRRMNKSDNSVSFAAVA